MWQGNKRETPDRSPSIYRSRSRQSYRCVPAVEHRLVPWKRIGLKKNPHCDLKGHGHHWTPQTGVGYHR